MKECGIYHLIKTPYNKYIFDANKNRLICDADVYDYLSGDKNIDNEVLRKLNEYKQNGYLLNTYPQKIIHNETENIDYHLDNQINSITLQLTQRCNFRCTYCIYSEDSSPYQRNHSNNDMSPEIAEKAVDFLFSHSRDVSNVNIGFYGGEPLLKFDLLKHIVEYVKENYYGKRVHYSITTNGSLMTDEVVEYFVENDIYPMISFDGPKHIHDKYRHFAENGRGTYDVVMSRLSYIKNKYPDYYKQLKLSIVVDPQNDLSCINDTLNIFYLNDNLAPFISLLSDSYGTNKMYIPDQFTRTNNDERVKTFLYALGYVKNGHISPVSINLINSINSIAQSFKDTFDFSIQTAPGGPCVPGAIRLMIDTQGNFFPCEHVSERSEVMKIGNIFTGFDKNKVLALLNVAQLTSNECMKCWAYHQCYQCAKYCDDMKSLSPNKRHKECYSVKYTLDTNIRYYLMLKELLEDNNGKKENCRIPLQL
jgi:uncharacterized protein